MFAPSSLALACPDPAGMFRHLHGRLALFRPRAALAEYWTSHWKDEARREKLLRKNRGKELLEYEPLLAKFMAPSGVVLEAGCGLSQVVHALHQRGITVRGVEFDRDVVEFVNGRFPELDVVAGDVNQLEIADGAIATYISLGVVEHFADGPERALREARRVLAPDGHALISVPLLNHARAAHLRRLATTDGAEREDLAFYQYYFSPAEFSALARAAGLAVVEWRAIFAETHLRNEHPIFSRLWRSRLGRSRLREPLRWASVSAPEPVRRRYGHMAMFVCRRA